MIDIGTPAQQLVGAAAGAPGPLLYLPLRLVPDQRAVPSDDPKTDGQRGAVSEERGAAAGSADGTSAGAVEPEGREADAGTAGGPDAGAVAGQPSQPANNIDGETEQGGAGAKRQRTE